MKLKAPDGCGSVSAGGVEYPASKAGIVDVPDEFVAELAAHGIRPATADEIDPPAKPKKAKD